MINVSLSTGERLELPWRVAVRQKQPWLSRDFKLFGVEEMEATVQEFLDGDPNDFAWSELLQPVWQLGDATFQRQDENGGEDFQCLSVFCPSFDMRPLVREMPPRYGRANANSSVAALLESTGFNMLLRVAKTDAQCFQDGTSGGGAHDWHTMLLPKQTERVIAPRGARIARFVRGIREVLDLGVELDVGDSTPGPRRVQLFSADVYFTTRRSASTISTGWHTDRYDVIIFMLRGSKLLRVAGRVAGDARLFEVQLTPGSIMFIPAGYFHLGGSSDTRADTALISLSITEDYLPARLSFDHTNKDLIRNLETETIDDALHTCLRRGSEGHAEEEVGMYSQDSALPNVQCRDWAWAASEAGIRHLRALDSRLRLRPGFPAE